MVEPPSGLMLTSQQKRSVVDVDGVIVVGCALRFLRLLVVAVAMAAFANISKPAPLMLSIVEYDVGEEVALIATS